MSLVPRQYQLVGRDFLAARRYALLADEMRVGKTPQAILAAQKIDAKRILVVCPAIAVPHWKKEFTIWWQGAQPRTEIISYTSATLNKDWLLSMRWDVVIVDEGHFCKNPYALRTKLIYGKDGIGWRSDRMWALSGTPATKHAGELWAMLRAFGVVGTTYDEFIRRYCYTDIEGTIRGTRAATIPELKTLLAQVMLRRTRKEVAPEMPAIDYQFLELDVHGCADLPSRARTISYEEHPNSLAEERIAVANAKAPVLGDHIAFAIKNGLLKQTVAFGWHTEPLTALATYLAASFGINAVLLTGATSPKRRVEIQNGFHRGEIQVVVANTLAAGVAIDLSAASHAYILELDWLPSNNVQAANRLVSMMKSEPVSIDVATVSGTTDDYVQRALMRRVRELSKLY